MDNYLHAHADGSNGIHLTLDPGTNLVGFVGKLTSKSFVILLFAQLVLKSLITLGHECLDLTPLRFDVLQNVKALIF